MRKAVGQVGRSLLGFIKGVFGGAVLAFLLVIGFDVVSTVVSIAFDVTWPILVMGTPASTDGWQIPVYGAPILLGAIVGGILGLVESFFRERLVEV